MTSYEKVLRLLERKGWDKTENISDFWFRNQFELQQAVDEISPGYHGIFGLQVRWKSEIGQECNAAIRQYIQNAITATQQQNAQRMAMLSPDTLFPPSPLPTTIDFGAFQLFRQNGQVFTLKRFADLFNTGRVQGGDDLAGIDLSGIVLNNCIFTNCFMPYSNFNESKMFQITFKDCIVTKSSFVNSYLVSIWLKGNSTMYGCDLSNAFVNNIHLESSIKYTGVPYKWLVLKAVKKLFCNEELMPFVNLDHTVFLANDTSGLSKLEDLELQQYVSWYQHVYTKIDDINNQKIKDKIQFLLALLFTKYWTSYSVLSIAAVIINLLFATVYHFNSRLFSNLGDSFISALYYSVVTFTTLGYGDITPKEVLGQILVMFEVIIGYIMLGIYVFLIGNQVSKKF